jgi:alkylated DNA repair dioxygenase AlkB
MQMRISSNSESLRRTYSIPDGELYFMERIADEATLNHWMKGIITKTEWSQPEVRVFNRLHRVPRLTAFYGDPEIHYAYAGHLHRALPWFNELSEVKNAVEEISQESYNSVLLNYYRDGNDRMGWHADNESSLGQNPIIASVSLGAERFFDLKHRHLANQRVRIQLTHGSLLVMSGALQHHWLHQIPAQKKIAEPRLNLTFRRVFWSQ